MLDSLITSKTRMKLLLKFFSNSSNRAYLRSLAQEMGESTNSVRIELNRFTEAGLLESEQSGNTIVYKANTANPFYKELNRLVMKYMGLDQLVKTVVERVGNLYLAYIVGDYANGIDSGTINLVLVGDHLDLTYAESLRVRAEEIAKRKIYIETFDISSFQSNPVKTVMSNALVLWAADNSGYTNLVE